MDGSCDDEMLSNFHCLSNFMKGDRRATVSLLVSIKGRAAGDLQRFELCHLRMRKEALVCLLCPPA